MEKTMILGMSVAAFTNLHVALSLIGIVSGVFVVLGMLAARRMPALTFLFLLTSVLTDITGFFFPIPFDPPAAVGIVSLVFLAVAILSLYVRNLEGSARWMYVVGAVVGLYLNCFVLVVQTFLKVPFFHALAPTQKEPPFAAAQGVVLILFIGLGIAAFRKFRPAGAAKAVAVGS
jgi:hypothetical protein